MRSAAGWSNYRWMHPWRCRDRREEVRGTLFLPGDALPSFKILKNHENVPLKPHKTMKTFLFKSPKILRNIMTTSLADSHLYWPSKKILVLKIAQIVQPLLLEAEGKRQSLIVDVISESSLVTSPIKSVLPGLNCGRVST